MAVMQLLHEHIWGGHAQMRSLIPGSTFHIFPCVQLFILIWLT